MTLSTNKLHLSIHSNILNIALGIVFFISSQNALTSEGSATYKWKDEKGMTNISDKPPPRSCTSADCKQILDGIKENAIKKAQDQEREKANQELLKKQGEEFNANFIKEIKQKTLICFLGKAKCKLSDLQLHLKVIGPSGVKEILGQPERTQRISRGYGYVNYWYYRIGGQLFQCEVDEAERRFEDINTY